MFFFILNAVISSTIIIQTSQRRKKIFSKLEGWIVVLGDLDIKGLLFCGDGIMAELYAFNIMFEVGVVWYWNRFCTNSMVDFRILCIWFGNCVNWSWGGVITCEVVVKWFILLSCNLFCNFFIFLEWKLYFMKLLFFRSKESYRKKTGSQSVVFYIRNSSITSTE